MSDRDGRLGVGVIGGGHVGPVLAAALGGAGHAIVGVATVSDESRDRVEALLPGVPILPVPDVIERSELVLIAVPDSELADLVAGLSAVGAWQPGQLVAHTSAHVGISVLKPAFASGIIPLALHPAMAFTGTSIDLARLRDAWCAVTAPAPALPIAQALAVEMGAEPVVIADADRPAYGQAIDALRALSETIVGDVVGTLRGIGVEQPGRVIGPLMRSAIDNALAASGGDAPLD